MTDYMILQTFTVTASEVTTLRRYTNLFIIIIIIITSRIGISGFFFFLVFLFYNFLVVVSAR